MNFAATLARPVLEYRDITIDQVTGDAVFSAADFGGTFILGLETGNALGELNLPPTITTSATAAGCSLLDFKMLVGDNVISVLHIVSGLNVTAFVFVGSATLNYIVGLPQNVTFVRVFFVRWIE